MLSNHQNDLLKQRFPRFELSYETITHKNVPDQYSLTLAIPNGRKSYVWFSFCAEGDVAYLLDLDKDRRIVKSSVVPLHFDQSLALGTVLYGVMLQETNTFIIEDIYYYRGIPMQYLTTGEKLYYIHDLLQKYMPSGSVSFALPVLGFTNTREPEKLDESTIPYQVHHVQYRSLTSIVPFLNFIITRKPTVDKDVDAKIIVRPVSNIVQDYKKPQYRQKAIFRVQADIQFDIYNLFVYGRNKSFEYYDVAYIPNYRASVFMNGLFRTIKENANIDFIEESEDEREFEDVREDRFVNLTKTLNVECEFNQKFKRWTPLRVIDGLCRVVKAWQL